MKRKALLKHVHRAGCELKREGRSHTIYINPLNEREAQIPRDTEVKKHIALKICNDLSIPKPSSAA